MKNHLLAVATLAVVAGLAAPTAMAQSRQAQATVYLRGGGNLYAGPDVRYPRVSVIQRGTPLALHGCLRTRDWCDVSYRARGRTYARGWVDANRLVMYSRGQAYALNNLRSYRSPTVTFILSDYWGDYYRTQAWYRDQDRYDWNRPVLRDRDRDGIPNRIDRDRDGDGRLDPRYRDQDRDGIPNRIDRDRDGDGVPNQRDLDRNNDGWVDPVRRTRDLDRDGIADHMDRDRDGDGIPNDRDPRPDVFDPRR